MNSVPAEDASIFGIPVDVFAVIATNVIGLLTIILTIAIAVWTARSAFQTWRRQQVADRQAQAAGAVLVAALEYIYALLSASSPAMGAAAREAEDAEEGLQLELDARWGRLIPPAEAEFRKAWISAEVYLSEEVYAALEQLWKAKGVIYTSQLMHATARRSGDHSETYAKGFGKIPEQVLNGHKETLLRLLHPSVKMSQAAGSR